MFDVVISNKASKDYSKLPKNEQKKISRKISLLSENPLAGKKLEGKLKDQYSVRAWPYRIIYIQGKDKIFILRILHRQGAYKF